MKCEGKLNMITITLFNHPDIPPNVIAALDSQNIPCDNVNFIMIFGNPPDEIIEEKSSTTGDTQYFCKIEKEFDIFTYLQNNHWYKAIFDGEEKAILINSH